MKNLCMELTFCKLFLTDLNNAGSPRIHQSSMRTGKSFTPFTRSRRIQPWSPTWHKMWEPHTWQQMGKQKGNSGL